MPRKLLFALLFLVCSTPAFSMQRFFGYCQQGGIAGTVQFSTGTIVPDFMGSYPGCTVKVYQTGTITLSTIYNDNILTSKANPFTADSTTGYWEFYAADGTYDVNLSGGGISAPFTLAAISGMDPFLTQTASGAVPVTRLSQQLQYWNVQQFGCGLPDGVTDMTACIQTAANAASAAGVTLYFPQNPVTPHCYAISHAIVVGNSSTATFIDWRGSSQPAGPDPSFPASCIYQTNPGQDGIFVQYAAFEGSVSIKDLNINYYPDNGNAAPPPIGTVTVSGTTVVSVSGVPFAPSWYVAGGNSSIYIHGSASFGCPGNVCTVTGVANSGSLSISQSCSSNCPTAAPYTMGVGLHASNATVQTVDWNLDTMLIVSAGLGFSSDAGTQSSTWRKGAFYNNYIGYNANGEILLHMIDWYFQTGVIGMQLTQGRIMLNSHFDSTVFEGQTGPQIVIDPTSNVLGGVWSNAYFEFPNKDVFHVLGSIHDWTCDGCIFDLSSIANASVFVAQGASATPAGMYDITLTGGIATNFNGGYLTVAENLSGVATDPTTSSDPNFTDWYLLGFDSSSGILRGFQTPNTNSAAVNVVMNGFFLANQFAISTITNQRPAYISLGSSNTGQAALLTSVPPFNQEGPMTLANELCIGPNCTFNSFNTLFINNGLNNTGVVNTSSTGNVVTWVSGTATFNYQMTGQPITIASVSYTIQSVTDATHLVLASSPGNHSGQSYTLLGYTRTYELAGAGQNPVAGPIPLHQYADVGGVSRSCINHDGYFGPCNSNNNDITGNLVLSGSGGPGSSATATFTMNEAAIAAPYCTVSYNNSGSLPTTVPGYSIALGPPTILTVYGQTGFTLTYVCLKADN